MAAPSWVPTILLAVWGLAMPVAQATWLTRPLSGDAVVALLLATVTNHR